MDAGSVQRPAGLTHLLTEPAIRARHIPKGEGALRRTRGVRRAPWVCLPHGRLGREGDLAFSLGRNDPGDARGQEKEQSPAQA